jgi:hypothetical protein
VSPALIQKTQTTEGTGFISPCFSTMSTATYRGIPYDTADYHMKQLEMIKRKIEKAQARYNAERVMAEQS